MRWIREHKLITAIIVTVTVLAVIFAAALAAGLGENPVGVVNKGNAVVSEGLTAVVDTIKKNVTGIFSYKALQEQIEELEDENSRLQKELTEAMLEREALEQLEELSDVLNYEYTKKSFDLVSADVVSHDGSNWTNVFTINRGSESGIEAGDAVVNGMGLVGRVKSVGKGWAKVVSIIDEDSNVSFKLVRSRKQLGIVSGSEAGDISGYMMDAESSVVEGDVIVTSGLGSFPEGLEIGSVKTVVYNSNTLLREITVEPAVKFKELEKVAVIK